VIRSHKSKKDKYSDSQKRTKGQTIIDIVDGRVSLLIRNVDLHPMCHRATIYVSKNI
jgi:hypothetical protein